MDLLSKYRKMYDHSTTYTLEMKVSNRVSMTMYVIDNWEFSELMSMQNMMFLKGKVIKMC